MAPRTRKSGSTETEAVLVAAAKAGLLPAAEADILLPALRLHQALTQILRLCVDGLFEPEEAPRGLLELLARAGELPDFPTLDAPSPRHRGGGPRELRAADRAAGAGAEAEAARATAD